MNDQRQIDRKLYGALSEVMPIAYDNRPVFRLQTGEPI